MFEEATQRLGEAFMHAEACSVNDNRTQGIRFGCFLQTDGASQALVDTFKSQLLRFGGGSSHLLQQSRGYPRDAITVQTVGRHDQALRVDDAYRGLPQTELRRSLSGSANTVAGKDTRTMHSRVGSPAISTASETIPRRRCVH